MNSFNLTGGGGPGPPFKCRFELFTRGQTAAKLRPWQRPAPGHSTSHFHSCFLACPCRKPVLGYKNQALCSLENPSSASVVQPPAVPTRLAFLEETGRGPQYSETLACPRNVWILHDEKAPERVGLLCSSERCRLAWAQSHMWLVASSSVLAKAPKGSQASRKQLDFSVVGVFCCLCFSF